MSTVKVKEIQHPSNSNTAVTIAQDSSVSLNHSGSAKLATTSTGVSVTGACAATSLSGALTASTGTFTGEAIFQKEITENVFAITGDANDDATLDPINGMIQTWTLTSTNSNTVNTGTDNLDNGQSMLLLVTAGSYTLTISSTPAIKWVGGSAPTLSTTDVTAIELFKIGSQLYGAPVGDLS
tara:strand:- start:2135 stop:2680 length:546 start_codon:yes stop_codon:yes gene_type:complete